MKTKNILLASTICFILTLTASAQVQAVPCVDRDGSPRPTDSFVYKVGSGKFRWAFISMPTAGKCHLEFESYDDRSEIDTAIMDTTGDIIGVKPQIKGDIEILIMDPPTFNRYIAGSSDASWSSGRRTGGTFDVPLRAGLYYIVMNNRNSPARKSVTLTLGKDQTLAPTFAPTTPETNSTQRNYSDSDEPPPPLKHNKKQ